MVPRNGLEDFSSPHPDKYHKHLSPVLCCAPLIILTVVCKALLAPFSDYTYFSNRNLRKTLTSYSLMNLNKKNMWQINLEENIQTRKFIQESWIKRVSILWNINWYKWTYLQDRNRLTDINIYGYQSGKRVREQSISRCKLVYTEWTNKKAPCTYSGEGNGTPLQYSCLENPMDGGAW